MEQQINKFYKILESNMNKKINCDLINIKNKLFV